MNGDTKIIDYSLWAVELGRDEYSEGGYDFQRADHQVRLLQAERLGGYARKKAKKAGCRVKRYVKKNWKRCFVA